MEFDLTRVLGGFVLIIISIFFIFPINFSLEFLIPNLIGLLLLILGFILILNENEDKIEEIKF